MTKPRPLRRATGSSASAIHISAGGAQPATDTASSTQLNCNSLRHGQLTIGIDGGYVRHWEEKQRHFEVIVGRSIPAFRRDEEEDVPSSKCFGFVQTLDTKPKRRLFEVLRSQGHQMNQQITFPSDSGDTVRALQLYRNPEAEHPLDWFHLSMRLTVLQQTAKGLPRMISDDEATYVLRDTGCGHWNG